MMKSPQIVTGITGSHCLVVFQNCDVYIDAKIESPGYTQVVVKIGGVPRLTIKAIEIITAYCAVKGWEVASIE